MGDPSVIDARCFDEQTFIRIEHPGVPEAPADYCANATPGKNIVVIFEGDRAVTLRRWSAN